MIGYWYWYRQTICAIFSLSFYVRLHFGESILWSIFHFYHSFRNSCCTFFIVVKTMHFVIYNYQFGFYSTFEYLAYTATWFCQRSIIYLMKPYVHCYSEKGTSVLGNKYIRMMFINVLKVYFNIDLSDSYTWLHRATY